MEQAACTTILLVQNGPRRELRFLAADGTIVEERAIPSGISLSAFPQPRLHCTLCERESAHPYAVFLSETHRVHAFLAAHALHMQHARIIPEADDAHDPHH